MNPATGSRELRLTSRATEIRIGERYYDEALQKQGGGFSVDLASSEYVAEVGRKLAAVSERPDLPYEFTVINSSEAHAWSLPGGKIAITRGLLTELQSEAELAAVVGHQIAHAAARHDTKVYEWDIAKSVTVTAAAIGATFFGVPLIAAVPFLIRTGSTSEWLTHRAHSDGQEIEADRLAMNYMLQTGYDPRAASDLLSRIASDRSSTSVSLLQSHPLSMERLGSAQMLVYRLDVAGTEWGERYSERYQREMSWLKQMQSAYADYDAGYASYHEDDFEAALALAQRAINSVPEEARFHELEAEVLVAEGRYQHALESYDAAVALDPEYARAYLGRASTRRALGDFQGAQEDFGTSYRLDPSATTKRELRDMMQRDWSDMDQSDPFGHGYNLSDPRARTPFDTSPGSNWYRRHRN